MANSKKQKSAGAARAKSGAKPDRTSRAASASKARKLDDVSDAPESGEPRAQGRSRGRIIDSDGTPAGSQSQAGSRRQPAAGRRNSAADPTAAARRDESGDTANEAWESGRQKAMGGPEE